MARCASALSCLGLVLDARGSLVREAPGIASNASGAASEVLSDGARALPRVPEAPLPGVSGPNVPLVGSNEPHSADPLVCGILGCVIVLNWICACCCATGGAATASASAEEGDMKDAEVEGGIAAALVGCVECFASICSILALVYACMTGLFRAWMGGQTVGGWCLAMAIISSLQLILCVCICCCASCGAAILGEEMYDKYINKHSKHVFGSHMHDLVHKHKPDGSHPIMEGHVPILGNPTRKPGRGRATEDTPLVQDDGVL